MIVWSFGDSNTSGFELGHGLSNHEIREWLIERGITNPNLVEQHKHNNNHVNWVRDITRPWLKLIQYSEDPEKSWAGLVARRLKAKHRSLARRGIGLDEAVFHFILHEREINWDEDLVLFGVPVSHRYQTKVPHSNFDTPQSSIGFQTASQMAVSKQVQYLIPSARCLSIFEAGTLYALKKRFPKLQVCHIMSNRQKHIDYGSTFNVDYLTEQSLEHFSRYYPEDGGRLPGLHFTEHVHSDFADHVVEMLGKKFI